ncbi:hypothetical protein [Ovoidimarina sediminis]|uniref:hypothetical protein n=1 Tax=Ovoidimarina sediminis TaxID=3079856 RepID=UPI0029064C68|nr:hypothetical protein [Rhodophyticola sp. MJ-SS7]MDU8942552.1 hypothetical protein [Rhodophyticola sp. MJ-SS7]
MSGASDIDHVFSLLVEVGRRKGDDLPEGASGAALFCYVPARKEDEAVRETVAILKDAGLAPLEVTSYGTFRERKEAGQEIAEEEAELMRRAVEQDAVVIAEMQPLYEDKTKSGAKDD